MPNTLNLFKLTMGYLNPTDSSIFMVKNTIINEIFNTLTVDQLAIILINVDLDQLSKNHNAACDWLKFWFSYFIDKELMDNQTEFGNMVGLNQGDISRLFAKKPKPLLKHKKLNEIKDAILNKLQRD